jgi:predicted PP-loop superfamily ATPase
MTATEKIKKMTQEVLATGDNLATARVTKNEEKERILSLRYVHALDEFTASVEEFCGERPITLETFRALKQYLDKVKSMSNSLDISFI